MPAAASFRLGRCETSSLLPFVPAALAVITSPSGVGRLLPASAEAGATAAPLPPIDLLRTRRHRPHARRGGKMQPPLKSIQLGNARARGSWGRKEEDGEESAAEGDGRRVPGDGL